MHVPAPFGGSPEVVSGKFTRYAAGRTNCYCLRRIASSELHAHGTNNQTGLVVFHGWDRNGSSYKQLWPRRGGCCRRPR
jgi:hypothetical protein